MKKFNVIHRPDELSSRISKEIIERIKTKWIIDEAYPELCIVVGGDGTFLYAVHHYLETISSVAFIGIHTGTLGFFTEYSLSELDEFIDDIIHREYTIESFSLLEIEVDNDEKKRYAVNEMRFENIIRTQLSDIYINDEKLETYRGTGICVSTQKGSSAYNRSVGGAVVFDGIELLQITEIAGIHHREYQSLASPLLVDGKTTLTFKSENFHGAIMCNDMKYEPLDQAKEIRCRLSTKKVQFAHFHKVSYIKRLRSLFESTKN